MLFFFFYGRFTCNFWNVFLSRKWWCPIMWKIYKTVPLPLQFLSARWRSGVIDRQRSVHCSIARIDEASINRWTQRSCLFNRAWIELKMQRDRHQPTTPTRTHHMQRMFPTLLLSIIYHRYMFTHIIPFSLLKKIYIYIIYVNHSQL